MENIVKKIFKKGIKRSDAEWQHLRYAEDLDSYFAAEIQASIWTAWEISATTTQSTIQKLTLQLLEVTRLIHAPLKTQNGAYSGLENKWTTKDVEIHLR